MFREHYQAVMYCILNDIKYYHVDRSFSGGWYVKKKNKKLKLKDIPDYWKKS